MGTMKGAKMAESINAQKFLGTMGDDDLTDQAYAIASGAKVVMADTVDGRPISEENRAAWIRAARRHASHVLQGCVRGVSSTVVAHQNAPRW